MPTEQEVLVRLLGDNTQAKQAIKQTTDYFKSETKNMPKSMPAMLPDASGINYKYNSFFKQQENNLGAFNNQFSRFSASNINLIEDLSHKGEGAWARFKNKGSSAIGSLSGKLQGLNSTVGMLFGGIALGGLADLTVGAAAENQQMESLLASTLNSKEAAADLAKETRKVTEGSMIMPNQLMKAAGILKMSTGMNKEDMKESLGLLKDMGQNLSLQGYAGKELENYLTASLDGLTGNWVRLRNNLGIEEEDVIKKGWTGKTDDVEGYMKAMKELLAEKANLDGSMDNTAGRMTQLTNSIKLIAMDIGALLLPILDAVLKFLLGLDDNTKKWVVGLGLVGTAIIAAAPFIVLFGSSLYKIGKGIWEAGSKLRKLGGWIKKSASKFSSAKDRIVSIFSSMKDKVGSIASSMKDKVISTFNSMKDGISSAASATKEKIVSLATFMKEKIVSAASAMKTGLVTAFNGIKTGFAQMTAFMLANPIILVVAGIIMLIIAIEKLGEYMGWWDDWGGMLGKFKDAIVNAGQQIWGYLVQIGQAIMGVFNFIKGLFIAYIQFVIWFWTTIFNTVVGVLTAVGSFIFNTVSNAISTVIGIITGIISVVQGVFQRIISTITGFIGGAVAAITNFGRSIWNGLKSSISNLAQTVWDEISKIPQKIRDGIGGAVSAITDFGNSMKNAFFGALDRHSPGIIQRTAYWEFAEIPGRIRESIPSALLAARDYGLNMVHGFNLSNVDSISDVSKPVGLPMANKTNNVYFEKDSIVIDAKDRTMHDVAQEIIALFENIPTN